MGLGRDHRPNGGTLEGLCTLGAQPCPSGRLPAPPPPRSELLVVPWSPSLYEADPGSSVTLALSLPLESVLTLLIGLRGATALHFQSHCGG